MTDTKASAVEPLILESEHIAALSDALDAWHGDLTDAGDVRTANRINRLRDAITGLAEKNGTLALSPHEMTVVITHPDVEAADASRISGVEVLRTGEPDLAVNQEAFTTHLGSTGNARHWTSSEEAVEYASVCAGCGEDIHEGTDHPLYAQMLETDSDDHRDARAVQVHKWATEVLAMVDEDIAAGQPDAGKRMPADVGSFSALHDYRDANCYALDLFDAHWENSPGTAFVFSDEGYEAINRIEATVDGWLRTRAPIVRARMDQVVTFAAEHGWPGAYGEWSREVLPPAGEADDADVDDAVAWLLAGRLTLDDWLLAVDATENAFNESDNDATVNPDEGERATARADAERYLALMAKLGGDQPLTGDDLALLQAGLCLSIATCDIRCADDMGPFQAFAARLARRREQSDRVQRVPARVPAVDAIPDATHDELTLTVTITHVDLDHDTDADLIRGAVENKLQEAGWDAAVQVDAAILRD